MRNATWEQERREVLDSVREELRRPARNRASVEACFYLMDHLDNISAPFKRAGVPVRPAARKGGGRARCGRESPGIVCRSEFGHRRAQPGGGKRGGEFGGREPGGLLIAA